MGHDDKDGETPVLLACPFCGGDAEELWPRTVLGNEAVRCKTCRASVPCKAERAEWNRRAAVSSTRDSGSIGCCVDGSKCTIERCAKCPDRNLVPPVDFLAWIDTYSNGTFFRGDMAACWYAAQRAARSATREIDCPRCKGSGEILGMTQGRGEDDYGVPLDCPVCAGTGAVPNIPVTKLVSDHDESRDWISSTPKTDALLAECQELFLSGSPQEHTTFGRILALCRQLEQQAHQSSRNIAEPKEYPDSPAAYINAIADEGTKAEAIEWLQKTWNELVWVRRNLLRRADDTAKEAK